jgi:hypothetical protein
MLRPDNVPMDKSRISSRIHARTAPRSPPPCASHFSIWQDLVERLKVDGIDGARSRRQSGRRDRNTRSSLSPQRHSQARSCEGRSALHVRRKDSLPYQGQASTISASCRAASARFISQSQNYHRFGNHEVMAAQVLKLFPLQNFFTHSA